MPACLRRMWLLLLLCAAQHLVQGTYPPANPCTHATLSVGHLYHPYPGDPRWFIQCDTWGNAFVQACPYGQHWDQLIYTCVDAPTGVTATRGHGQASYSTTANAGHTEREASSAHGASTTAGISYIHYDYPPPANYYGPGAARHGSPLLHLILLSSQGMAVPRQQADLTSHPTATPPRPASNHEVCASTGYRYLPDRKDMHSYYECVGDVAVARTCEKGQVWVQPLHQCMQLEDPAAAPTPMGGRQGGSVAAGSEGGEVQDLGQHNPCLHSDTQFHPYPGNPSKYLECQVWHRVFLWSCAAGQLWSQELQACVQGLGRPHAGADSMMGVEVTNAARQGADPSRQSEGNPCKHTIAYYQPYPEDPTRYIQCDQFGNNYLRKCGPNKIWDDFYKTCVGHANMTAVEVYPEEDTSLDVYTPMDNIYEYPGGGSMVDDERPPMKYVGCPLNYEFMPDLQLCVQYDAAGEIKSAKLAQDDGAYRTSCPSGYRYSMTSGKCVEYNAEAQEDPLGPHCSGNTKWNRYLHMCTPQGFLGGADIDTDNMGARDQDVYTTDHSATYGYNDMDTGYGIDMGAQNDINMGADYEVKGAARRARHVDSLPYLPEHPDVNQLPDTQHVYVDEGENPCGKGDGFYFAFQSNPYYYIQCDQMGQMFVQPCENGNIWNDDIGNCVPDLGLPSPSGDARSYPLDIHHVGGNPCPGATHIYHPFAGNERLFIMCVGDVAYPMACPLGAKWVDAISTCQFEELPNDTIVELPAPDTKG